PIHRLPPSFPTRRSSDLVNKISKTEIDSILAGFCNMYNKESFQAQPRLYKLNESQFAITFPYDIKFEIYCYFVNYVHYPMGFDKDQKSTRLNSSHVKISY